MMEIIGTIRIILALSNNPLRKKNNIVIMD